MNPHQLLPHIDYICIWATKPRTKAKKGHNRLSISDRYQFTGYIDIDGNSYRVQFVSYGDVLGLLTGELASKVTHRDLYATYLDGIKQGDRDFFSPVIAPTAGRIGTPAVITKGEFECLPYAVLSMDGPNRIEMDVMAVELETLKPIKVMSLLTEPGGIIKCRGVKPRWLWRRERPKAAAA